MHYFHQTFSFPSPAKLNLFLYITGKRADGYHDLQTLFQFLDIGDEISIQICQSPRIRLLNKLTGITTENNLIYRAANLLQEYTSCLLGADITINKTLPMGAGLGGGSSNAATVLVALNHLWQTGLSLDKLAELGLSLGADVPIFVKGFSAFAEGVGEKLTFCDVPEKWYVVLKPNISISTALIFQHPQLPRNTPKRSLMTLLKSQWSNDCENIVCTLYSEVQDCLTWLSDYAQARLTGTGSCVFAEFDSQAEALSVLAKKPNNLTGFVAKGQNRSTLHQYLTSLSQFNNQEVHLNA